MRLSSRIKGLERAARCRGGACCPDCGLPRERLGAGPVINAISPPVVRIIDEVEAERRREPGPRCPGCGRVNGAWLFRIDPPVPARQREAAA